MKIQSPNGAPTFDPLFTRTEQASKADGLGSFASTMEQTAAQPAASSDTSAGADDSDTGSSSSDDGLVAKHEDKHQSIIDEFMKWAHMSPEERIRAQYLHSLGMEDTDLTKLPPDLRQAIEDEIKRQVKEMAQKQETEGKV